MTTAFVCDEEATHPGYDAPEPAFPDTLRKGMSARDWALGGLEVPIKLTWAMGTVKALRTAGLLLLYGHYMRRMTHSRGVTRVDDLEGLADAWLESLVTMSTAHGHDERSRMDEVSDDLMRPLLTAPIAQVRQFVPMLARKLEADPRVPFLVWSSFKQLVEPLTLKGPDGAEIELQQLLAVEVANLVVPRLSPEELVNAMAGALQWRSPETLTQVKAALIEKPEAKPQLKGRQSCLFLHVDDAVVVL